MWPHQAWHPHGTKHRWAHMPPAELAPIWDEAPLGPYGARGHVAPNMAPSGTGPMWHQWNWHPHGTKLDWAHLATALGACMAPHGPGHIRLHTKWRSVGQPLRFRPKQPEESEKGTTWGCWSHMATGTTWELINFAIVLGSRRACVLMTKRGQHRTAREGNCKPAARRSHNSLSTPPQQSRSTQLHKLAATGKSHPRHARSTRRTRP